MPVFGDFYELEKVDAATNTNKYYRSYVWTNITVFQWGRIGARPQSQRHVYSTDNEAVAAFNRKVDDKCHGGYQLVTVHHNYPIPPDVLEATDSRDFDFNRVAQEQATSVNPFEMITITVDRCRRLAMGDKAQIAEAVVLRSSLIEQLAELRTSVLAAEGQVEIVDMLLERAL